jgi:tetratricopeptide (TPR) repeat protein
VKSPARARKRRPKNRSAETLAAKIVHRASHNFTRNLFAILALCTLTLLAFSNSFQAGFILDNNGLLLDPRIREVTPENIALILKHTYWWPSGEAGLYRPFTTLSYLFNYAILGDRDQPAGYHSVNLILHLGNVLLAYALGLRLLRRFWPAVFIAALWSVHPALTESVTNIVGRADLLAAMAVLSGFLMYLKSTEASGWAPLFWLAGLAIVTAIGIFSKESTVAILPLILLYELVWWKERRPHRALVYGCIATLLPIAVMLYQRSVVLAASPPAEFPYTDNPIVGADWWTGRLTAVKVMARYLWLTIWPAKLSVDYSYNQIPVAHGAAEDWLAYAVVLIVAIVVILLYRWNRTCFFLACFAFLNFLPASNLLFPIGTILADRLLYLPSLGLLACSVLAIYTLAQKPKIAALVPIVLGLITVGFTIRTWIRNRDWRTDFTIATADVRVSPNSFKLHRLLAASLFESDPAHSKIDQVIAEQEKSLALIDSLPAKLRPPDAYRLAGYYYLVKGDQKRGQGRAAYERALQALLRCLEIDQVARPSSALSAGDSQAYLLLSVAYLRLNEADQAYDAVSKARALDPLNPQVYRQLSDVYAHQRRNEEADIASMQASAITSLQQGRWQQAADLTDRVLSHSSADYPAAYYLNAMANLRLGKLDLAEKSASEAIRLDSGHRNPRTTYVLGLILAEKQDFARSAQLLKAYLAAAPNSPDAEVVQRQLTEIEHRRLTTY